MADSTSTRVAIVREETYGELPDNPTMQQLRFTSSNLSSNVTSKTSNEIDDSRNIADSSMVGIENSGDIETEFSHLSHDELIAGALFSEWSDTVDFFNETANTPIDEVNDDVVTVTADGTDLVADDIVRFMGFSDSSMNKKAVVVSSTATSVTMDRTIGTSTNIVAGSRIKKVGVQASADDIAATTNSITSTTLDFTTLGLVVGSWIKLGGSETATRFGTVEENNGFCRILSVDANEMVFDIVPDGFGTDGGSGKTIELFTGEYIRNGTTRRSYSIEQRYLDTNPEVRQMFTGIVMGSWNVSLDAQSIVTASYSTMGANSEYLDAAPTGQSYYKETLTELLNTSSNVGRIAESGARLSGRNCIMSATLNVDNSLRGRPCIGSIAYRDIGAGRCTVTGNLNTYFGSAVLAKKILSNEETSIDFRVEGLDGSVVLFDLPRIKFQEGSTPITGIDTDVMLDIGYQALVHPSENFTLHVQRFSATQ